jgi:PAS domain S-box-containing protein
MPTVLQSTPAPRVADDANQWAEHVRFLSDETELLIYDCDATTGQIVWHGPVSSVLGYAPGEFGAMDLAQWENLIHPDDRAEAVRARHAALSTGGRFHLVYRLRHRAGHYVPVRDRGLALAGAVPHLVGSLLEFSADRRHEQAVHALFAHTAATTGPDFFQTLAREVCLLVGGQAAGFAYQLPGQSGTLRAIATWCRHQFAPPADLPLRASPAWLTLEQGYYETTDRLADRFPQWAAAYGADRVAGYAGIALSAASGETLGVFSVLFGPGTKLPPSVAMVMRFFAGRASAELERLLRERDIADGYAHYRQVVDGLPEGVIVAREDRVLFANAAAARLLGYASAADMLGVDASAHTPAPVRAMLNERIHQVEAGQAETFSYEATLLRRDGSECEVDLITTRTGFKGQPALQLVLRDITERRRIERAFEAVRRATADVYGEAFFRSLVNELGPLLGGHRVVVGQLIETAALRLRSIARWPDDTPNEPPAEFAANPGSPAAAVLTAGCTGVPGVDSYIGVALRTGAGRTLGLLSVEYAPGQPRSPLAGVILQLFAARAAAELERLEVEEALRAGEARFRSLSESSPVGVFQQDQAGHCIYANERWLEITGRTLDQTLGQALLENVHPDDRGRIRQSWAESAARGTEFAGELRILRPDGSVRWVSLRARPMLAAGGRPVGAIGTADDVSDRVRASEDIRRLNAELEQRVADRTAQLGVANAELEAFSYSVSHDLRSPLRAIDGFSRALEEDFAERLDDSGRDYLRRIRSAGQRMGHLIDDLLRLSRASRVEMRRENVDLSALAAEIATELQAHYAGHTVEFICAAGLHALADRALTRIVLLNLLDNAWKYTRRQSAPRVELALQPELSDNGGGPVFAVSDNGAGFDMRYAGKLFAPFQRLHSPAEFEGTGIGLATVKRIVARHGGRAWVEAAVNRGTKIYFTFGGLSA